jgi:hypothetical protein
MVPKVSAIEAVHTGDRERRLPHLARRQREVPKQDAPSATSLLAGLNRDHHRRLEVRVRKVWIELAKVRKAAIIALFLLPVQ